MSEKSLTSSEVTAILTDSVRPFPRATVRLGFILLFTFLTAIAAQIKFPFPGSPVPATMQTAVVLAAALWLGGRDGVFSQVLYVGLGAAGFPLFAGMAGFEALSGPRGGYIIGFVVAAAVVGYLRKYATNFVKTWLILFFASLFIFGLGVLQLKMVLSAISQEVGLPSPLTWSQAMMMGVVPFIIGDILKVSLVATAYSLKKR